MKFSIKVGNPENQQSSCIVIGVFESSRMTSIAKKIDKISRGYISNILSLGELEGKIGQTLLLYHVPNILAERVLLVGCGKERELDKKQYKLIINQTIKILKNTGSIEAVFCLTELHVKGHNNYWNIRHAVEIIKNSLYSFNELKRNTDEKYLSLRKIIFNTLSEKDIAIGELAIHHGMAISCGINVSKDLANMPPNICNPSYLASKACQLGDDNKKIVTIQIIGEKQMQKLGMNAYLAVGQGSDNESLMSIIEYKGNQNTNTKPIVFVGKGITFDVGGISIKPSNNMEEMKYDMCGAAAVYGLLHTAITLKLPLNIIGILAGCENMVDGRSFRPGDIVTTLSGQTVEILNTDAEGRLVMCDVLTYIQRFNPELVIDVATLTGACVIALGHDFTGLMSNNNSLSHELIRAAKQSGDYAWRLPLSNECQSQLESNYADMVNIGTRSGGAITAGCFLSRFTSKYNWAHLDIAGTAWNVGKNKGATGRPVAMLSQFLLNRSIFYNKK